MIAAKLVRRYAELKLEAPGCVLLMQVGAFMKVLDEDARAVSGVTGLKLQMSGSVEEPVVPLRLARAREPNGVTRPASRE